jgi:hypothetical protein
MSTVHPRHARDLMLAPTAAGIDLNLQRLRDLSPEQVQAQLALELDYEPRGEDRAARTTLVLQQALRQVELHGWQAAISDDGWRLHLTGGSVSLDLGLSAGITRYLEAGLSA